MRSCCVRKSKKYTTVFGTKMKKTSSSKARNPRETLKKPLFHPYLPDFRPKSKEKRLLTWQTKDAETGKRQKRKTAFTVPLFRWIRLLCGAGPVAALTAPRAVIHYRPPSNPPSVKKRSTRRCFFFSLPKTHKMYRFKGKKS